VCGAHSSHRRPRTLLLQLHCPVVPLHVAGSPAVPAALQLHASHSVGDGGIDTTKSPSRQPSHILPVVPAVQLHTSPPPLYRRVGRGSVVALYSHVVARPLHRHARHSAGSLADSLRAHGFRLKEAAHWSQVCPTVSCVHAHCRPAVGVAGRHTVACPLQLQRAVTSISSSRTSPSAFVVGGPALPNAPTTSAFV
jgi:hypothetical protein